MCGHIQLIIVEQDKNPDLWLPGTTLPALSKLNLIGMGKKYFKVLWKSCIIYLHTNAKTSFKRKLKLKKMPQMNGVSIRAFIFSQNAH